MKYTITCRHMTPFGKCNWAGNSFEEFQEHWIDAHMSLQKEDER